MSDIVKGSGSGKGFMAAAVIGAAVGAGVALLVAPRSGRETREWLALRTQEVKDGATSALDHGKEMVRQAVKEEKIDGARPLIGRL